MPKKTPTPFEVDGVQCTEKDGLVNVGLNSGVPSSLRFPVKVKPTDDRDSKVRSHAKFPALLEHVSGIEASPAVAAPAVAAPAAAAPTAKAPE